MKALNGLIFTPRPSRTHRPSIPASPETCYTSRMARPDDSIMDMVNNIEPMYERMLRLFDKWISQGDAWYPKVAQAEALRFASFRARDLQEGGLVSGRYAKADVKQAAKELLEAYQEYKEYHFKEIAERPRAVVAPRPLDPEDVAHASKYEAIAQSLGVDLLRRRIPASQERIRRALETGDSYLNTIPLHLWDSAAAGLPAQLSHSEKVCVLKHVAKWHFV